MNPDKRELLRMQWSQKYPTQSLQEKMDEIIEVLLMNSNFIEADRVIEQIKRKM